MKKSKLKSLVKSAKKAAKSDIEVSFILKLTEVTDQLGKPSKKLKKTIAKGAKQLAKKIAKELPIDKDAVIASFKETEAAKTPETPVQDIVIPAPVAASKPARAPKL
jgi:hypothetical protein